MTPLDSRHSSVPKSRQDSLGAATGVANDSLERITKYRRLKPYRTPEIKVLLLESVSKVAVNLFREAGFQVEVVDHALPVSELREKLKTVHAIGVRSKTALTDELINEAACLLTIGCFCIGTNHVALEAAAARGIAVFNSPFSNSRSVAELIIGEIIMLSRQLGARNTEMHNSVWDKASRNCHEIRGRTLGIVGYGHIGAQLSVLAESLGMNVIYYDLASIMPLGTAKAAGSLAELLQAADFVTLHVPETNDTKGMLGSEELALMKSGSYLLNASRGSIVDLEALRMALENGHIAGAALDVYPAEPEANGSFATGFEKFPNVILTPHIGGSTEEAQEAIGLEVASHMIRFVNEGASLGAVNFPLVALRNGLCESLAFPNAVSCRLLNVHQNIPGVLKKINKILRDCNIDKQLCDSKGARAYVMVDITADSEADLEKIYEAVFRLPESIATRLLYWE